MAHEAMTPGLRSAPFLCLSRERENSAAAVVFVSSSGTPAASRGWGCVARPRGPRAAALARPSGGSASGGTAPWTGWSLAERDKGPGQRWCCRCYCASHAWTRAPGRSLWVLGYNTATWCQRCIPHCTPCHSYRAAIAARMQLARGSDLDFLKHNMACWWPLSLRRLRDEQQWRHPVHFCKCVTIFSKRGY
jgi:hypothetical protein